MTNRYDTYKHKGLRKKLVEQLREKGISDEKVLQAMNRVPRHLFLDSSFLEFAYQDKAFPIGSGQTISQPYTVAFQTELLKLDSFCKVLEIGTGSGYQAAVLLEMGMKVYSIERQKNLFQKTKKMLEELGYFPKMFYGDGYKGQPAFAPFDRILITAATPEIPKALINQLKPGGRLVAPVGNGPIQVMTSIDKDEEGGLKTSKYGKFSFVPMLGNRAND
jgi:protein-L-isoaspartate(D-aspartate) O-methyltransferase